MHPPPSDGAEYHELLRQYIQSALQGQQGAYHSFLNELRELKKAAEECGANGTASPPNLLVLLHCLTNSVSLLHPKRHEQVLQQVLGMKLWSVQQDVRAAVLDLLVNLVVANASFLLSVLHMLVYCLLPPPGPPSADDPALGAPWTPNPQAVEVQDQVLAALDRVMSLLPAVPTTLQSLLLQQMPHKLRDRSTQCLYLRALFALAELPAGAAMRDGLLAGIIEHLLSVDVEIRWEDIADITFGIQEEEQDEDEVDIFELEGMGELSLGESDHAREGWEGVPRTGAEHADASTSGRPPVDVVADKLDSMMELTFEHLSRRIEQGGIVTLWAALLPVFERSVLHTQRSKFTQFLLFYVCSRHPQHCAPGFVSLLLQRLGDPAQAPITRAACAAYLASFLARAAFVSRTLLLDSLSRLAELGVKYADSVTPIARRGMMGGSLLPDDMDPLHALPMADPYPLSDVKGTDVKSKETRHQVFYAMCQALLYALCYHLQSLAHKGSPHLPDLKKLLKGNVSKLINHPLNPLRMCLPSVVSVFVQRLVALQLAGVANLPKHATQPDPERAQRPLEMFFPFDPYLLRRSAHFLDLSSTYLQWRHGRALTQRGGDPDAEGDSDADTAEHEDTGDLSPGGAEARTDSSSSDDDDDDDDQHHPLTSDSPSPFTLGRRARLGRPTSIAHLNSLSKLHSDKPDPTQPYGTSPMSMGASPAAGYGLGVSLGSAGAYSPVVGTSPTAVAMSMTPDLSFLPTHFKAGK